MQRIATGWDYAELIDQILDKGITLDHAGRVRLPDEDMARTRLKIVADQPAMDLERTV